MSIFRLMLKKFISDLDKKDRSGRFIAETSKIQVLRSSVYLNLSDLRSESIRFKISSPPVSSLKCKMNILNHNLMRV
jgi:hypothetical protein